jgi:hypothetical protein
MSFLSTVVLEKSGDYEGTPIVATDADQLANCIGEVTASGLQITPAVVKMLRARQAQAQTDAAKDATEGSKAPDLKWASYKDDSPELKGLLSAESIKILTQLREINGKAAEVRKALLARAVPEVTAAIVKAKGKAIPTGKRVIVTLQFGKFNVAVGDESQASKAAKSLGDLF